MLVDGVSVCITNVDNEFFAVDGVCPHAAGPLGDGVLDGTVVKCPWHGWGVDVCTGLCAQDNRIRVDRYTVKVDGDELVVSLSPPTE